MVVLWVANILCSRNEIPMGLILISPLLSAVKTVTNFWIPGDMFKNYSLAPGITCSTLILHGDQDTIVPHECGKELSELFPKLHKFVTLEGCDHNNIWVIKYFTEIKEFIKLLQLNQRTNENSEDIEDISNNKSSITHST